MTLIQSPTNAWGVGARARFSGTALIVAVLSVAVLCAAIVATSMISKPSGASAIGAQGDPFVQLVRHRIPRRRACGRVVG